MNFCHPKTNNFPKWISVIRRQIIFQNEFLSSEGNVGMNTNNLYAFYIFRLTRQDMSQNFHRLVLIHISRFAQNMYACTDISPKVYNATTACMGMFTFLKSRLCISPNHVECNRMQQLSKVVACQQSWEVTNSVASCYTEQGSSLGHNCCIYTWVLLHPAGFKLW